MNEIDFLTINNYKHYIMHPDNGFLKTIYLIHNNGYFLVLVLQFIKRKLKSCRKTKF